MVSRWLLIFFVSVFLALFLWVSTSTAMNPDCSPVEEKSVKVEAWMSKQYEKSLRQIRNEFSAMGNTRVTLWVYPEENPSKIVAIGSCVPSYRWPPYASTGYGIFGRGELVSESGIFFLQLDRSRYVPIFGKLSSANHSRPTHWVNGCLARYPAISKNLSSTHYTAKKVKAFGLMLENPKLLENP